MESPAILFGNVRVLTIRDLSLIPVKTKISKRLGTRGKKIVSLKLSRNFISSDRRKKEKKRKM